jgi:hypothetical protein
MYNKDKTAFVHSQVPHREDVGVVDVQFHTFITRNKLDMSGQLRHNLLILDTRWIRGWVSLNESSPDYMAKS